MTFLDQASAPGRNAQTLVRMEIAGSRMKLRVTSKPAEQQYPRWLVPLAAVVLVGVSIFSSVFMRRQIPDDAFIFLRMAHNIVERGEWSFNAGHPVNAATSPLYCLVVSSLVALRLPGIITPLVVAATLSTCALGLILFRGLLRWGVLQAFLATLSILLYPVLVRCEGMETMLYLACVAAAANFVESGNEYGAGVMGGLAFLGRPEGLMMVPIALAVLGWRQRRLPWRGFLIGLLPVAAWACFCISTFHTLVPHTMKLKAMQSALSTWGIPWFHDYITQLKKVWLLAPFALLGLLMSLRRLKSAPFAGLILLFGIAQVAGYSLMHAPSNYFWYDAPGDMAYVLALVLGAVTALEWAAERYAKQPKKVVQRALVAVTVLCFMASARWERKNAAPFRMSQDYIAASQWLKQHAVPSDWIAVDEIGYVGVYSGLQIRDMLGLADATSVLPLQQRRWDFWLTDGIAPRFVIVHQPAMAGEPTSAEIPWSKDAIRSYVTSYHKAFRSGSVQVMQHN